MKTEKSVEVLTLPSGCKFTSLRQIHPLRFEILHDGPDPIASEFGDILKWIEDGGSAFWATHLDRIEPHELIEFLKEAVIL
jgi:hypothetical protein